MKVLSDTSIVSPASLSLSLQKPDQMKRENEKCPVIMREPATRESQKENSDLRVYGGPNGLQTLTCL